MWLARSLFPANSYLWPPKIKDWVGLFLLANLFGSVRKDESEIRSAVDFSLNLRSIISTVKNSLFDFGDLHSFCTEFKN